MQQSGRVLASLCATENTPGLQRCIETLRRNGIEQYVYGLGEQWQGNGMKQVAALHVAQMFLGKYKFILALDAYDVFCLAPEDEIIWKFMSFQHPMVIAGEINCWPDKDRTKDYPAPRCQTPYKHLNGGAYMAQTEYLAWKLKEWGVSPDFRAPSDQRFLTDQYLKDHRSMKIDEECVLFQTMCRADLKKLVFSGRRLVNLETETVPCFLHGNGKAKMEPFWDVIK